MCDLEAIGAPSKLRVIHNAAALARMLPTFDLSCEEKVSSIELGCSILAVT